MVRLTKSALPEDVKINSHSDWSNGTSAKEQLIQECHAKCYICEDKPEMLTVDHIKPRDKFPQLGYDWNNLLLACSHCNGVKGSKFGGIINPTESDPEFLIRFEWQDKVKLTALCNDSAVNETVALLNAVYNGVGMDMKVKMKCTKLVEKMKSVLRDFELYINHINEPGYAEYIREEISRSSIFVAFKRTIIQDSIKLAEEFADALA